MSSIIRLYESNTNNNIFTIHNYYNMNMIKYNTTKSIVSKDELNDILHIIYTILSGNKDNSLATKETIDDIKDPAIKYLHECYYLNNGQLTINMKCIEHDFLYYYENISNIGTANIIDNNTLMWSF